MSADVPQEFDFPWLKTVGIRNCVDHPDRQDIAMLANPPKIDGERLPNPAASLLAADGDPILGELGDGAGEIGGLPAAGVI